MARYPRVERSARLQPRAQPVDAYARPPEPPRSNLHQLAEALGGFDRSLRGFLQQRQGEARELDRLRGEAEFYKGNTEGFAEGTRRGLIPSFASPAFMDGYKAAQGRVAGMELKQRFEIEYMNWAGKDGDDPEAFSGFLADFLRQNINTDDPRVLRGLLPEIRELQTFGEAQFSKDLSNNIYNRAVTTTGARTNQAIDQRDLEGLATPTGTDYDELWADIMELRQEAIDTGIRPEDIDGQLMGTIAAKAAELRDPKLLELLDRQVPGRDYTYADTPEGQKIKLAAFDRLETMARQMMADEDREAAKRDKAALAEATLGVLDHLLEDPLKAVPDALIVAGEKVDPKFRLDVLTWQKALLAGGAVEDPAALTQLYTDILGGGGMAAVTRGIADGIIRDPQSLREAVGFVKGLDGGGSKVLQGPTFKGIMDAIKQRTLPHGIRNPWDAEGLSDAGIAAQTDYQRLLMIWAAQNPDASDLDAEKARVEIGRTVLDGIDRNADTPLADPTYARPGGEVAPAAPTEPEAQPQGAAPVAPAEPAPAAPVTPQQQGGDATQWFNGLTPEQRQAVERDAARRGVSPEQRAQEVYEWLQQQAPAADEGDGVDVPASPINVPAREEGESFGAYIDRVFSGDQPPEDPAGFMRQAVAGDIGQTITTAYAPTAVAPSGATMQEVVGSGGEDSTPYDLASKYLGLHEKVHTTTLSSLFKKMGGQSLNPAQTAWCAAFVNAVLGESGRKGTNTLLARDFLNYGRPTSKPTKGDIVVFWRGSRDGWKGHVGFYHGEVVKDGTEYVQVLGGNQGNAVRLSDYPKEQVLGYRRPPTVTRGDQIDAVFAQGTVGSTGGAADRAEVAPASADATRAPARVADAAGSDADRRGFFRRWF